jgi:hypothetical protein
MKIYQTNFTSHPASTNDNDVDGTATAVVERDIQQIHKLKQEMEEQGAPTYLLLLQVGRPIVLNHCRASPAEDRPNQQNRNPEQHVRSGVENQHGK